MNPLTEQLIEAYEAYIILLGDELTELAVMAVNRGWQSTRYEEGKAHRTKIEKLIRQLKTKEPSY